LKTSHWYSALLYPDDEREIYMIHRPRTTDNSAHHLNRSSTAAIIAQTLISRIEPVMSFPAHFASLVWLEEADFQANWGDFSGVSRGSTRLVAGSDYVTGGVRLPPTTYHNSSYNSLTTSSFSLSILCFLSPHNPSHNVVRSLACSLRCRLRPPAPPTLLLL
jgi:hypothetical protein